MTYDGVSLAPDETYHWCVRVWDENGERSPWSESSMLATSLSDDADWAAAAVDTRHGEITS